MAKRKKKPQADGAGHGVNHPDPISEDSRGRGNPNTPTACPNPQKSDTNPGVRATLGAEEKKLSRKTDGVEAEPPVKEWDPYKNGAPISRSQMTQIQVACNSCYEIPEGELRGTPAMLTMMMATADIPARTRIRAAQTLLSIRQFALKQIMTLNDIGILNPHEESLRVVRMPFAPPGEVLDDDDEEEQADED